MDFICACKTGNIKVVDRLLQDPSVDPCANDNHALRWSVENGHLEVVERPPCRSWCKQ